MKKHRLKSAIILVMLISAGWTRSLCQVPDTIYQTESLAIVQLSNQVYQHISYLQTETFGHVPCNGMIVMDHQEAIVFDTPTDEKSSNELIQWIELNLHSNIKAVVPTHFHEDCLGGLNAFHEMDIPSYANEKTIEFARANEYAIPENGFTDTLSLLVGQARVYLYFPGEGHTRDNIVAYFPHEKALFGGCLVKTMNASKGFLGDANTASWSASTDHVLKKYPEVQLVIPGHGKSGGAELLSYT
ncbi:MAG TPA: subclass B1 metallo-beta-lactamase, partial [Saprospiraceae bacterium]|nr:subclass B1 metallo-beta-lactamase [Saprospiraceae bacterium]